MSDRMTPRTYPFQPLLDAIRCDDTTVKARLGLDFRQVARYHANGLTERRADELACKARLDPYLVWPEMIDHNIEDASKECAADDCAITFVPASRLQRYCSHRCNARVSARRRYAESAEVRERRKAHAKRSRAQAGRSLRFMPSRQPDARRVQSRRYYEQHAEEIRAKRRERYASDAEHRAMKLAEARTRYHLNKNDAAQQEAA